MFEALKTQIDIIQKSAEDFGNGSATFGLSPEDAKRLADKFNPHLPSLNTKLEQLKSKLSNKKKKKQNTKSIFEEIIGLVNKFLEAGKKVNDPDRFTSTNRLRQHVIDSVEITKNSAKQILMDCVKNAFFANDGICGADRFMEGTREMDEVNISPLEIDFLHMFKVPPDSDYGKVMYEGKKLQSNKIKINRGLYSTFIGSGTTTPNGYQFQYDTPSNKTLFNATWQPEHQYFHITGLTQPTNVGGVITYGKVNVGQFFDDYYSNMEMPNLNDILKQSMLLTLKACSASVDKTGAKVGGSFSGMDNPLDFAPSLDDAIKNLERMLSKIFAFCNNGRVTGTTPTNLFHDEEEDQEFYFNFDDVEGIDLEDEDARRRKVLKFVDCNNYEVPYNAVHMEDFVYLEGKTDTKSWIDGALNKAASDAYEQSDFSIDLPNFQLSINLSFIINIPKALIMSILSPKMFLPFVIIYKQFVVGAKNAILDAKDLMRKLKKIFTCTITELFWKFIREFWKKIKADLKNFLLKIIKKILRDKLKRYYLVISALIALLKQILENGIDNCAALIAAISAAISGALSAVSFGNYPTNLLLLADKLPGFSAVKATMDITEKMQGMGIPTGDVNGEPNYHILSTSAHVEGMADNLAVTPFLSTNKQMLTGQGDIVPQGQVMIGSLMKNN
jgi:hypothetical protein